MAKVRTRNYKVVTELVCKDGAVIPVVGANVRYFAHQNRAVNFADIRTGNVKKINGRNRDRMLAITVYKANTPKRDKHGVMKYRAIG